MNRALVAPSLLALLFPLAAGAGGIRATTELRDADGARHLAAHAVDGLLRTGWAEGEAGGGAGSTLQLDLDQPTEVVSVSLWPGNWSHGWKSLREYGRPKTITVTLLGGPEEVSTQVRLDDPAFTGPRRVDVPIGGRATSVRVAIDEVYDGVLFADTYVAELAVNLAGGPVPDAVAKVAAWVEGAQGQKAAEKAKAEVIGLYDAVVAAPEGDREALGAIVERAADGALHLRDKVARDVPAGFRVHALPPDATAVDAILKIKDPNAVAGLELAAWRATGKEQKRLAALAEMLYAHAELIGGPDLDVPPWGETGWSTGQLRGFGEPLHLAVDQAGQLYVADVGNHRVQRFGANGLVDRTWGGEPALANAWFGGARAWHVSGSPPEEKPGAFVNPMGVAVIPGKDADAFAVLDATGRIQHFDPQGRLLREWNIRPSSRARPGVGGQGHLVWAKNRLVAILGDEAVVYDLAGEEKARFELGDGAPSGATALKNGKLALIFDQDLVMYSLDGFRHGSIVGDELPDGFEAWDVAVDAKGALWAVTDTGWLFKYKKPGVVDYSLRFTERALTPFRFAVRDDVVYLLESDRIERIDALELKARAEAE